MKENSSLLNPKRDRLKRTFEDFKSLNSLNILFIFIEVYIVTLILFFILVFDPGRADYTIHLSLVNFYANNSFSHWYPVVFPGSPLKSDPLSHEFYLPLRLFIFLFGITKGFRYCLLFHILMTYIFARISFRECNYSKTASITCSFIYTFNGVTMMRLSAGHVSYIFSYPWLILTIVVYYYGMKKKSTSRLLIATLAYSSVLFAGNMYYFIYLSIILLICSLPFVIKFENGFSLLIFLPVIILLPFSVFAPLVPLISFYDLILILSLIGLILGTFYVNIIQQNRVRIELTNGVKVIAVFFGTMMLTAIRWLPILMFHLTSEQAREVNPFWGRIPPINQLLLLMGLQQYGNTSETYAFIGLLTFLFSIIGLTYLLSKWEVEHKAPLKMFILIMMSTLIWIALPLPIRAIYLKTDVLSALRHPARLMIFLIIGAIGMVGYGIDTLIMFLKENRQSLVHNPKFYFILSLIIGLELWIFFEQILRSVSFLSTTFDLNISGTYSQYDARNKLVSGTSILYFVFLMILIFLVIIATFLSDDKDLMNEFRSYIINLRSLVQKKRNIKKKSNSTLISHFWMAILLTLMISSPLSVNILVIAPNDYGESERDGLVEYGLVLNELRSLDTSEYFIKTHNIPQSQSAYYGVKLAEGYHGWSLFNQLSFGLNMEGHYFFDLPIEKYIIIRGSLNPAEGNDEIEHIKTLNFTRKTGETLAYGLFKRINYTPFCFAINGNNQTDLIEYKCNFNQYPDHYQIELNSSFSEDHLIFLLGYTKGWQATLAGEKLELENERGYIRAIIPLELDLTENLILDLKFRSSGYSEGLWISIMAFGIWGISVIYLAFPKIKKILI